MSCCQIPAVQPMTQILAMSQEFSESLIAEFAETKRESQRNPLLYRLTGHATIPGGQLHNHYIRIGVFDIFLGNLPSEVVERYIRNPQENQVWITLWLCLEDPLSWN